METRPITPGILVLRHETERAVLVRGKEYVTAIDVPASEEAFAVMLAATQKLEGFDQKLAVLKRDMSPYRDGFNVAGPPGMRQSSWEFDDAPDSAGRGSVSLRHVHGRQVLYDDAGRAFHCEPSAGREQCLAVRIQPENVLVVADDLRPDLPPEVVPGCVMDALARFESWRRAAPEVIVPASGIPIAGDEVGRTLDRSIRYLQSLRDRISTQTSANRFPWERLIYTIPWCDHWDGREVDPALYRRHRHNVREMAADIMMALHPEVGIAYLAA